MQQEFRLLEFEVADEEVRELERFELPFVEQPSGFHKEGDGSVVMLQIPFSSERLWNRHQRRAMVRGDPRTVGPSPVVS